MVATPHRAEIGLRLRADPRRGWCY